MSHSIYYKEKMQEYREWELLVLSDCNRCKECYEQTGDYAMIKLKRASVELLESLNVFSFAEAMLRLIKFQR